MRNVFITSPTPVLAARRKSLRRHRLRSENACLLLVCGSHFAWPATTHGKFPRFVAFGPPLEEPILGAAQSQTNVRSWPCSLSVSLCLSLSTTAPGPGQQQQLFAGACVCLSAATCNTTGAHTRRTWSRLHHHGTKVWSSARLLKRVIQSLSGWIGGWNVGFLPLL